MLPGHDTASDDISLPPRTARPAGSPKPDHRIPDKTCSLSTRAAKIASFSPAYATSVPRCSPALVSNSIAAGTHTQTSAGEASIVPAQSFASTRCTVSSAPGSLFPASKPAPPLVLAPAIAAPPRKQAGHARTIQQACRDL